MADRKDVHAIMFPIPYQGHINPMTNLALKLASKGFSITFVHTQFVHHTLSKAQSGIETNHDDDFFSKARNAGLNIRSSTISDGFPLDFDRDLNFNEYWGSMLQDFQARVDEFVEKIIQSDPSSVYFLVVDTWFHWLPRIAKKYNLLSVSFWTQPATIFSFIYHLELLKRNGHLLCKGDVEEEINYIPGVESINTRDLIPYLKEGKETAVLFENSCLVHEEVDEIDFILHNTVQELESGVLTILNEKQPNYAIGPVNFFEFPGSVTVTNSLRSASDCDNWLNSKPPGSVLYISFGSLVQINRHIVEEIAYGLMLSEVNFIWVVRSGILGNDADILPLGFEDEIKDRGLIIPWCNQIQVLSNPAVGGFLTHCGWNSIVESMWCGVPMLCYPIWFEQPTNQKLLVEDWKIGVRLCDGPLVQREEVAEKIKSVICGINLEPLTREIRKVQSMMRNAIEINGSSERNFDRFIEDLEAKLHHS